MEKRIIKIAHKLSNKSINHNQFDIKKIKTNLPFHIRPKITNIFRKKENRKYSIIIPIKNLPKISNMSEKEITKHLENDIIQILETQGLPGLKMAGFTLQYLISKMNKS